MLLDVPLIAVAAFGAFALRFDWLFLSYRPEFPAFLIAAMLIKPLVFYPFGLYARFWRYASVQDVFAIVCAVSASSVAMALFVGIGRATGQLPEFARPVILADWLLTLVLAGGLRLSVRVIGESREATQKSIGARPRRVMVVGAGEAGILVVRELRRNPQIGLHPVVFLDDSTQKRNKTILGIDVRGPLSTLDSVAKAMAIDEAVIAMPTAAGATIRSATEACRRAGVPARIVPGVFELLDGQVTFSRLRRVEIADLLRRRQAVGRAEHASYLEGHSVLITGAGGSIGSELARQVAYSTPARLVLLGHGENSIFSIHAKLVAQYPNLPIFPVIADVRNATRLDAVFKRYTPEVVFHAAAHKHVPLMEANPEEAITNNVWGTANVLGTADRWGVQRLVLISTDKAVEPTSTMGASKRLAEQLVLHAGRRSKRPYVVVRFGNVLGSRGSVVPTFQAQIERGGPITITHPDMKRFFMTIPEAVQLVLQAAALGAGGELFVLNMGEQLRILDLAKDLIRLSGLDPMSIPVEVTGVRPGEKLEEVLWEPESMVDATSNPDVFRVKEPHTWHDSGMISLVDDVIAAAECGDTDRLKTTISAAISSCSGKGTAHPDGSGSARPLQGATGSVVAFRDSAKR